MSRLLHKIAIRIVRGEPVAALSEFAEKAGS
jgi:hypothetical protein